MERHCSRSIAKKMLLGTVAVGATVSLYVFDGRNSQSIDAAGNTPTPNPLPTNTLELTATKIPIAILTPTILPAWQTVTVAAGQLRKEQDQVSAEQTLSAINTQRARLANSPTPTVTPNILATQIATDKAVEQELTDRRETATVKAVQTADAKTPTVVAAKPTAGEGTEKNQGGGLLGNILWALGGAAVVLGIVYRNRIAPTVVAVRARFAPPQQPPPPSP